MNIREIIKLSASEKDCEDYLIEKGVLKRFETCYKCGHPGPKRIRRDRYACYKCDSEWSVRRDSFLKKVNISYSQFILCLKMIEMEISISQSSRELGISEKTLRKIYKEIYDQLIFEFSNNRKAIKAATSIFSISSYNGQIKVEQLEQVEQTKLNDKNYYVFGVRRKDAGGNVFYDFQTDRKIKKSGKSINVYGPIGNFWSFATIRLISYNGSVEGNLFAKLKEIELRFNCIQKKTDVFEVLLEFYKVRN